MSVNTFMHPRNIYRVPPNFKQLAIEFPDFRKYVKQDLTGKVSIDFKDPETLRALTVTLLKKDFGINLEIPLNRLIPTVPLRLNYVLWIEDLLNVCDANEPSGIDIGAGSSCIYALLLAKLHNWQMLATDIDNENIKFAQQNVSRNNLNDVITVKKVEENKLLLGVIDRTYDFCMCNPPFFSSANDLDFEKKSRTYRRPPPRNAFTGDKKEVTASGGELEFITKLINESTQLLNQVRIYTTMIGHKSNIPPLKLLLRSAKVASFTQTEFCQGHTTRWGLAWTFSDVDLRKVVHVTCSGKKSKAPLKYMLPKTEKSTSFEKLLKNVKDLLITLQMESLEVKRNQKISGIEVSAFQDTWSNQRRKRRQQNRCNLSVSTPEPMEIDVSEVRSPSKRSREDETEEIRKRLKEDNNQPPPLVKFMLVLQEINGDYSLEMSWIDGTSPKDTLHQIMQYYKNNLK